MAKPLAEAALNQPSALFRSGPGAVPVVIRDSTAGPMKAAPTPWSARMATSRPGLVARPPIREARPKRARPGTSIRRRPSWSLSRPPRSSRPP